MSGFEVAGVVLGTFPLVITAIEAYMNFLADWGKTTSELRSMHRRLSTEQSKLYNLCDRLLSDIVPQKDIEPMLKDPFGSLWQDLNTNDRIRRRLWASYGPFRATISEVQETMATVEARLKIHVSDDGHVTWVEKKGMSQEFKKFLFRLNRKDFQDSMNVISRAIGDLESLTQVSIGLESKRQIRSSGKTVNILRNLSSSLHRALGPSISCCNNTHDINLGLCPKIMNTGYEGQEEAVVRTSAFRVAISFVNSPDITPLGDEKHWGEVKIKPTSATKQTASTQQQTELLVPSQTKSAPNQTASAPTRRANPWLLLPSLPKRRKSLAAVTQGQSHSTRMRKALQKRKRQVAATTPLAKATTTAVASSSMANAGSSQPLPLSLCVALRGPPPAHDSCYGQLMDSQCPGYLFSVFPQAANNMNTGINPRPFIRLQDVLERKPGLQPLVLLSEKLHLALAVASSFLLLGKTPWLPGHITKQELRLIRSQNGTILYQDPFLFSAAAALLSPSPESSPPGTSHAAARRTNALFSLGILLLEIILGCSLEELHEPKEKTSDIAGDAAGIIRDSITVSRLLRSQVSLLCPEYRTVIERCISCTSDDLGDEGFREKVYSGVVLELERMLESATLT